MLTILHPNAGTADDPIPVPVLPDHTHQADALHLRVRATSSHGPDEPDLMTVSADSDGIWVVDSGLKDRITGGVIETFKVYLTPDLVGKPDTIRFRARKYAMKAPNGARLVGKTEGDQLIHFAPVRTDEPATPDASPGEGALDDAAQTIAHRAMKIMADAMQDAADQV